MKPLNIAVIFAGGVGVRMHSKDKPKQFLELHGKPIIIYTLEIFDRHPDIDGIVVSCKYEWMDYLKELLVRFNIHKVVTVVPGGETSQLSIFNGLDAASKLYPYTSIVLIHDGVRPLINHQTITDNIESVKKSGTAITTAPTIETFVVVNDNQKVQNIPDRAHSKLAKAPQSFFLHDILRIHKSALKAGIYNSIDSCTLMNFYNRTLTLVEGPLENIKITTPMDYYIFRAILEAKENTQLSEVQIPKETLNLIH